MKSAVVSTCFTLAVAGGDIPLTWSDCSDETYKTAVTKLVPDHVTIGQTTMITGTGHLLEDITEDINFDGRFRLQLDDCTGDSAVSQTCKFPLDTGHIGFVGMEFPVKAGEVPVEVDVKISKILPATALNCTVKVEAVSKSKGTVFCLDVDTTRSPDSHLGVGILDVTWSNCGDDALVKVDELTPAQIKQGEETKFIGKGTLLEDITEDDVDLTISIEIALVDCAGNAAEGKKCKFPLDLGYLDFQALPSPVSAGDMDVSVALKLSNIVPSALVPVTTTHVHAWTQSGEKVFCLDVMTNPDSGESDVSV
jgi:hypothetical protein